MQQKHIIPISDPKIENLYNLWLNNGFEKEEKIDIKKALLKGSEKDLHQINLYSIEHNGEILSSVILIFQIDNPYISGLGEVCTKIDVRGNNYASKLCKLARDDFFSIDNSECNFLGTVNPNAARIYKSLGWKKIKNSEVMFNSINFFSFENFVEHHYIESENLKISMGGPRFRLSLIPFLLSNKQFLYSDINIGTLSEIKSASCLSLYEQYNSLSKKNGHWLCMHNMSNQIYGISTYITRDKKKYRIDGFSNHLYKNDFYELIKRTYNLILKNDPSEVYVDILVEDEFKMEIFSELGFVLSNNYYCKFEDKTEKLCNRMVAKIN
mgnify:FL=1